MTWAARSVLTAVARTSPFVTRLPTLTLTSLTDQVAAPWPDALESVDPPATGALPKARSQVADEATEPVAATSSRTSATDAVAVRNVVAAAAPRGKPPKVKTRAPPPTAGRRTIANTFSFTDPTDRGRHGVWAPNPRTVRRPAEKSLRAVRAFAGSVRGS